MSNSPPNIGRVFVVITIVVSLLHWYIGSRLLSGLSIGDVGKALAIVALVLSVLVIPSAMLARMQIKNQRLADKISWVGYSAMGVFSFLFVLTFLRDVLLIVGALIFPAFYSQTFQHDSAVAVLILTVLASVIGFINAIRVPVVVNIDIPLKNLAQGLQGFTIAQISDIHIGPTIKKNYLVSIVKKVNFLNPHLVAITGDLIDGTVSQLADQLTPLRDLKSDYGSYFVTGNHEYYSGVNQWIQYLRASGIRVLQNEHDIITHKNAQIIIAGITDFNAHQIDPTQASNPRAALAGLEASTIPKIMLAHQPRSAEAVSAAGADLQLSGHTHGGQFWPWNLFVPLQQPYVAGLHKLNNLWVYVNRGTGYWGPPIRLGKRSEITLLRLVPAE